MCTLVHVAHACMVRGRHGSSIWCWHEYNSQVTDESSECECSGGQASHLPCPSCSVQQLYVCVLYISHLACWLCQVEHDGYSGAVKHWEQMHRLGCLCLMATVYVVARVQHFWQDCFRQHGCVLLHAAVCCACCARTPSCWCVLDSDQQEYGRASCCACWLVRFFVPPD